MCIRDRFSVRENTLDHCTYYPTNFKEQSVSSNEVIPDMPETVDIQCLWKKIRNWDSHLAGYYVQAQCIVQKVNVAQSEISLSLIHISEPTRPLYISYAVFCLKKKKKNTDTRILQLEHTH
eukprot:TRINITY_DN51130_c0_g1_i2.p1 TRINITY_DN51130_c0_g1~~TRINITY_DN51130_c0_g1_i2.p1  ORF type:complete len:121 (-),score=20.89 TRINITY_DN51130_c0_g1_i2:35-397(-)